MAVPATLDPGRLRVLEALVERLLPADELGGGALEARVADYVTRALAHEHHAHARAYAEALDAMDAHARDRFARPYTALAAADQDEVVAALEREEVAGAPASFFELVRSHVVEGMFGDPRWGGNAGGIGWRLLGYPGPRLVWTADDQRVLPAEGA